MVLARTFGPMAGLHIDDPKCMRRMMRAIGFRKSMKDKGKVVPPTHRLEQALNNTERAIVGRIMDQMSSNNLFCEIITNWYNRHNESDTVVIAASKEGDNYLTYGALNPHAGFLHEQARDNWNARPNKKLGIVGRGHENESSGAKKRELDPTIASSLSQAEIDCLRCSSALSDDELDNIRLRGIAEKHKFGPLNTWFKERLPLDVGAESYGLGGSPVNKWGTERHPIDDSEDDDEYDGVSVGFDNFSDIEGFVGFEDEDEGADKNAGDGDSEEQKADNQKKRLNKLKHRPQKDRRSWIVDIDTIDRSKCQVGKPEPEKLKITFQTLTEDLDNPGQTKRGRVARYKYTQEVDWEDKASIAKLNFWRSQLLGRRLGPRIEWLVTEQNLAFQQFLNQLSRPEVNGNFSKINWDQIYHKFKAATVGTTQRAGEPLVPVQKTPPSYLPRLSADRPAPRRTTAGIRAQLVNWNRPDIKEAVKQSKIVAGLPLGRSGIKKQPNPFGETPTSKGEGKGNAKVTSSLTGKGNGEAKATPISKRKNYGNEENCDSEDSEPSIYDLNDGPAFNDSDDEAAFGLAVVAARLRRKQELAVAENAYSKPLHKAVAALKGKGNAQTADSSNGKGKAIAPEDDPDSDDLCVPYPAMSDYAFDDEEEKESAQRALHISRNEHSSAELKKRKIDYAFDGDDEETNIQRVLETSRREHAAADSKKKSGESSRSSRRRF